MRTKMRWTRTIAGYSTRTFFNSANGLVRGYGWQIYQTGYDLGWTLGLDTGLTAIGISEAKTLKELKTKCEEMARNLGHSWK